MVCGFFVHCIETFFRYSTQKAEWIWYVCMLLLILNIKYCVAFHHTVTAIHGCLILKCFSMLSRATVYLFYKEDCTDVPVSVLTGRFLFISTCGILVCFLVFHILLIPFPVRCHSLGLEQVLFRTDDCLYRYCLRSAFSNSHKWFLSDPFRYHQL